MSSVSMLVENIYSVKIAQKKYVNQGKFSKIYCSKMKSNIIEILVV
jgi:hypothetical protein